MIIDGHVRIGEGREVMLSVPDLLTSMDSLGVDRALVAPAERYVAYANREGNAFTTDAARASDGRLSAYAVANPWRGMEAIAELEWARTRGAAALAVDAVLQGFDLLDGLVDPLVGFAAAVGWPVYIRSGTPPAALPLAAAELARRHPSVSFILGKSGATDFWIDAIPALRRAPNLYADTAYGLWDTVLDGFARDPEIGTARIVFSSDAPYTLPAVELARLREWPIPEPDRDAILGGNLLRLLDRGADLAQ